LFPAEIAFLQTICMEYFKLKIVLAFILALICFGLNLLANYSMNYAFGSENLSMANTLKILKRNQPHQNAQSDHLITEIGHSNTKINFTIEATMCSEEEKKLKTKQHMDKQDRQIAMKQSDQNESVSKGCPICVRIGTRSEGWAWPSGHFIRWAKCEGVIPECMYIGTDKEGWYAKGQLIALDSCGCNDADFED